MFLAEAKFIMNECLSVDVIVKLNALIWNFETNSEI